ncbi:MAG: glucosylglycerol hydrolase [Candidatus Promineifilaceae bacterium]|nr:glucosylglycerol hydrolase [Candidatus Promineifilaceae bacterium]
MPLHSSVRLNQDATNALVNWAEAAQAAAGSPFEAARQLTLRLGAHYRDGHAEFGFWLPQSEPEQQPVSDVYVEVLRPRGEIDFASKTQVFQFRRWRLPLRQSGGFAWGAVAGLRPGSRERVGDFYRLSYQDHSGEWRTRLDPLAYSVPFGAFAPAELYDVETMLARRPDQAYFDTLVMTPDPDGVPRVDGPVNILQVHVGTATSTGTLAGLTALYSRLAEKVRQGAELSAFEANFLEFDAIQLMPVEPTIEHEGEVGFWQEKVDPEDESLVNITLLRPDILNWGYDVAIAASPAVNPTLLSSGRPDELLDLIVALHHFPHRPIKLILDIVYGHADNQSSDLLDSRFIAGPGMYGQVLNYRHPVVRAMLLEMQRRKSNYGVDGLRVDGAQDFKYWDPTTETMIHDDAYLREMNDLVQQAGDVHYRPWMIFEDGRPWPRADWELASTYGEVTKVLPNVVQWGPLTFAHNTPFLFTFWISKWWRVREMMDRGALWISGCANHDTLRRGTQVDPEARINDFLGHSLPDIFRNAYDNPAANLFTYAIAPGIPMDFTNALARAPWSFIRNTDDRYAVKVLADEARFLDWTVTEDTYGDERHFRRLKSLGYPDLARLRRFMTVLNHEVQATSDDEETVARLLNNHQPALEGATFTVGKLRAIARAWMEDVAKYCTIVHYAARVDPAQAAFNRSLRQFRRARPWLQDNLGPGDHFDYLHPTEGSILYFGLRSAPDDSERILFLANMEGKPRTVTPRQLPVPNLPQDGWQVALHAPSLAVAEAHQPLTLGNGQGIVYIRHPA